jgi:hypothetical protein
MAVKGADVVTMGQSVGCEIKRGNGLLGYPPILNRAKENASRSRTTVN